MQKILVPKNVYHIKGQKNGPVFFVLAGVHGDEIFGIEVVKEILKDFKLSDKMSGRTYRNKLINGELYIGFGNPEAIARKVRATSPSADLNRAFQLSKLKQKKSNNDPPHIIRAKELLPILSSTDFLIDLHSTHTKSEPFICLGDTTKYHSSIYEDINVQYVLTDPDWILPKDIGLTELGTTDYVVNTKGGSEWNRKKYSLNTGIGFAYESGHKKNFERLKIIQEEIYQIMYKTRLLIEKPAMLHTKKKKYKRKYTYKLTAIIKKNFDNEFRFQPGLEVGWVDIKKGDCIGEYSKINKRIIAPCTGKLLFQKEPKDMQIDSSLCYIATKI